MDMLINKKNKGTDAVHQSGSREGSCASEDQVVSDAGSSRGPRKKAGGKRPHTVEYGELALSSSEENLLAAKISTARRGRASASLLTRDSRGRFVKRPNSPLPSCESDSGMAPLEGDVVRLTSTKADLLAARREERRTVAADEVAELAREARERRSALATTAEGLTSAALSRQVTDGVNVILKVATKSGNLKGTFTRALKEAADGIKEAMEVLLDRTTSEETAKLQEENGRLQDRVGALEREIAALRADFVRQQERPPRATAASAPAPGPLQSDQVAEIARAIMLQVGGMMNARLESLEPRLLPAQTLRPPLAADKRREQEPPKARPAQGNSYAEAAKKGPRGAKTQAAARGTPKKGQQNPAPAPAPMPAPAPVASQKHQASANSQEGEWQTVGKKGKKKKKGGKKAAAKQAAAKSPKLRVPRSTAVVITLQPGAEERGVSYASVLTEAKRRVDLAGLGIPSLQFKRAVTGARILEIPGAATGDKADSLAEALRGCLKGEDVKVSRPSKCAELRVSGLDDSVTPQEVCAAVARCGGCAEADTRVGEIRRGPDGRGTAWLRCPVAAAKTLVAAGHMKVGWVEAKVTLLEPRPMQCYRCLYGGHVQHTCSSEVDRSDQCYRCSQPGHRAAQCSAAPHCSLCAAAGKSAGHRVGAKSCSARAKKGGKAAVRAPVTLTQQTRASAAMDVADIDPAHS